MRVPHVGFHAAQAENYLAVALRREVLRRIQRFIQRDAEPSFDQDRKFLLLSDELQQFEILGIAGADLQHDAGGIARRLQRRTNLVDVRFVRNLHGDDFDSVLSGEFEHVWQAFGPESLECIRVGARFVGAHASANLAVIPERLHHRVDRLRRIDRAETGENVEAVLSELDAVVLERRWSIIALLVPAEHAIGLRNANRLLDARQDLHLLQRQRGSVADEIDLGQRDLGADLAVDPV